MKVFKLNFNNQSVVFESPDHLTTFLSEEIEANLNEGETMDFGIKVDRLRKEEFNKLNEFEGVPKPEAFLQE